MESEDGRLEEVGTPGNQWRLWGPYLSERQWATVREDYSLDGTCWEYFPHDHARSRAYRWGEDGLMGISDRKSRLNLALCLWNGQDPILKERLFGLTGNEGNHGEDVKELYYYLDNTPTHSYMASLYKYPHQAYPYDDIVAENKRRSKTDPEYELLDTGVFDDGEYWDVKLEYCKAAPEDILARFTVSNRGSKESQIHILPQLWFRNMWSWGTECDAYVKVKPHIQATGPGVVEAKHFILGDYIFEVDVDQEGKKPEFLFTENDTNLQRLFHTDNSTPYVKDAFHNLLIHGDKSAVNPALEGTKCAPHYTLTIEGQEEHVVRVRLYRKDTNVAGDVFSKENYDDMFERRKDEADKFYDSVIVSEDAQERLVMRQAYAGLLWSKQFYYYIIQEWMKDHTSQHVVRNEQWTHLFNRDVISMPDKWEYPWYASWDLAFHMLPFASIDIQFCKEQTLLFLQDWYMHPNGQIPAYEFALSDVNPPVLAYSVLKIYKASGETVDRRDHQYLARCFHKLVMNFTWWVNRKDPEGLNVFEGGFLGLDNIGAFDRSKPVPAGGKLAQADGTAWMAFFCELMVEFSLILAQKNPVYEDLASKFFEHFVYIMEAINFGSVNLWDEEDEFYYDTIVSGETKQPLKLRSMVGLVPFFSSLVLWDSEMKRHHSFYSRTKRFLKRRKKLAERVQILKRPRSPGSASNNGIDRLEDDGIMLTVMSQDRLISVLKYILDEEEFLSPYGIRSLSKYHERHPFTFEAEGHVHTVNYEPGESKTVMFGGNSNWRGPIWLPMNYMVIENLERYDSLYGDSLKVECPTRSGNFMRLADVAKELSRRLSSLLLPGNDGHRPCHGRDERYAEDPHWKDLVLFYEYFHGETGRGCGASHQTGWTALMVNFLRCVNNRPLIVDCAKADIGVQP